MRQSAWIQLLRHKSLDLPSLPDVWESFFRHASKRRWAHHGGRRAHCKANSTTASIASPSRRWRCDTEDQDRAWDGCFGSQPGTRARVVVRAARTLVRSVQASHKRDVRLRVSARGRVTWGAGLELTSQVGSSWCPGKACGRKR